MVPRTEVGDVLAAKRREVEAELAQLTAPQADAGDISFGKRVGDGTSMAVERLSQVAVHGRLQELLAEIARAEEKLADFTYGVCESCGGDIPPERLEALPWAVTCVACPGRRPAR